MMEDPKTNLQQPSMMQSSSGKKKKKSIFNYPSVPVYLPPPQHVQQGPLFTSGSSTRFGFRLKFSLLR